MSFILQLLIVGVAFGFFTLQKQIPNGDKVKNPCTGENWPGVGHIAIGGAGDRNSFGADVNVYVCC